MCMTIDPANLDKTILLAHEVEVDGRTLNVIGYQNNATTHGVDDCEITYIEVRSMQEIIEQNLVDWANIGMITETIYRTLGDGA